jgi:hypothetical protein
MRQQKLDFSMIEILKHLCKKNVTREVSRFYRFDFCEFFIEDTMQMLMIFKMDIELLILTPHPASIY